MELDAAKMIGAGLAVIALFGVGIGIGNIFSTLIATANSKPIRTTVIASGAMPGMTK